MQKRLTQQFILSANFNGGVFMVYVLNNVGQPLMCTHRYAKIRKLLKNKLASVVQVNKTTLWNK